MTLRLPMDVQDAVAAALCQREPYRVIAERFGISRSYVEKIFTARRDIVLAARDELPKKPRPGFGVVRDFIIPRWVPADLRPDFIDNAMLYGEQRAARIVSRMKAEAARPEV